MPYIEPLRRTAIDALMVGLLTEAPNCSAGDLNYIITRILIETQPQRYADYNALVGVLECAKLEFYHRLVRPYEDLKLNENGDIYV